MRSRPLNFDPVTLSEWDDGFIRCDQHKGEYFACQHIAVAIKDNLDAWNDDFPPPDQIQVPMFTYMNVAHTPTLAVNLNDEDDNGFCKFVLNDLPPSDLAHRAPLMVGHLSYKDGRWGIREQILPWLVDLCYLPERRCGSDLHAAMKDKNIENLGQTNREFLLDTVWILKYGKCLACWELERDVVPDCGP